jgi:hypothetical protein
MQVPMKDPEMTAERMQGSSEIVIISTPKEKDVKTSDSAFTDDLDDTADADSRYDHLDSRQRPISGATNQWNMPGEWNADAGRIASEGRREEAASRGTLRGRLEEGNRAGRIDYQKDGLYGRHSFDSDEDSAGFRSVLHYGLPPEETVAQKLSAWSRGLLHPGMRPLYRAQDKSMPTYAELKAVNEQFSQEKSSARLSGAADDQPRGASLAPDAGGYTWPWDVARSRTPEETMSAPRTFHPAETKIVSQNTDIFARQQPPASPPGQVQSRPAILPFPKKPGSVFQ